MKIELLEKTQEEVGGRTKDIPEGRIAEGISSGSFKYVVHLKNSWLYVDTNGFANETTLKDIESYTGTYKLLPKGTFVKLTL